jgi:arylsulfatase A-like enzyme
LAAGGVTLTAMLVGLPLPRGGGYPSVRASLAVTAAALLVGGATALGAAPPFPPSPGPVVAGAPERASVVLIVLDTVRADHLESYGYPRRTMPNLARFAAKHATRVERAIANSPSSLASHASFFTGVTPARHGAHKPFVDDPDPPHYAYPLGPELPTLAELLGAGGYWTVGVAANPGPLDPAYGIGRGFDAYTASAGVLGELHLRRMSPWRGATRGRWPLAFLDRFAPFSRCEFFGPSVAFQRATAITDTAIRVVDLAGDRPFFLFVNYFDAHFPYRPPYFFRDTYPGASQPGLREMTDWRRVFHRIAHGGRMRPDERDELRDTYDSQLHYVDSELERLLDHLEHHRHFDTMLVIITSDHGEALGEHGLLFHSVQLYDEVLRVPLFVKPGRSAPPDFQPGAVVPGPFQSVDVFATILAHAEVGAPAGLDGVSWGAGRRVSVAETYVHQDALRQVGPVLARELHALERDGWRLVRSSRGEVELYDIRRDPAELQNRTADEPARTETYARELEASLGRGRLPGSPKPQRDSPGDALRERLRSLGYAE